MTNGGDSNRNIEPDLLPLYKFGNEAESNDSVEQLYVAVQDKYKSVVSWYLERKSNKRDVAQRIRLWAIGLATASATGLVLTALFAGEGWAKYVGAISSALLVISAGLVAFDRFFGYSSSWIRFVLTALVLQKELNRFQLDMNDLTLTGRQGEEDVLVKKLKRIQDAFGFLYMQLQNEAHQWAEEFRGNLNRSMSEIVEEIRISGAREDRGDRTTG